MRYREGDIPEVIGPHVTDDSLLFSAVLGLLIGCACLYMGIRGRQVWLMIWGSGLVLASLAYMIFIILT